MDVRVGPERRLSTKESMLLNCGVGEDFRVPWTARRSNQSILKEISPEYSLEGLMLKLKLQHFRHQMRGTDSDAGKDWRQEEKGTTEDEMVGGHHWLNGHEFEQALGDGEKQGSLACCSPWGHKESTWLSNWTISSKNSNRVKSHPWLKLLCFKTLIHLSTG